MQIAGVSCRSDTNIPAFVDNQTGYITNNSHSYYHYSNPTKVWWSFFFLSGHVEKKTVPNHIFSIIRHFNKFGLKQVFNELKNLTNWKQMCKKNTRTYLIVILIYSWQKIPFKISYIRYQLFICISERMIELILLPLH